MTWPLATLGPAVDVVVASARAAWRSLCALLVMLRADATALLRVPADPAGIADGDDPIPAPNPATPTPPGVPLAYATAAAKLEASVRIIDQLDTKAGVVVGAIGVAGGIFLASGPRGVLQVIAGVPLVVALALATFAFAVRKYEDAPEARRSSEAAGYPPEYMQEAFLGNVLDALQANRIKAARKGLYLNWSVGLAAATAMVAVLFPK
jgi:hypothetical protein